MRYLSFWQLASFPSPASHPSPLCTLAALPLHLAPERPGASMSQNLARRFAFRFRELATPAPGLKKSCGRQHTFLGGGSKARVSAEKLQRLLGIFL